MMATHASSVNFENLIKDLADMYPYDVGTVVIVELIANSLDSKATTIHIDFEPKTKVLTITDNGTGMTASNFDQYHDFAAGLKTRGMGIGFAGVGAKVSFNIATRVITETRSKSFVGGSNWYLQSNKKLLWEDITPKYLRDPGTRVEVMFRSDAKLPFFTEKDIIHILRQNYLPLLDRKFLTLYDQLGYYSKDLTFIVNGKRVEPGEITPDYSLEQTREFFPRRAGKRIGYGILGLAPHEYPLAESLCGVLLCTRGKVIKADLFNQFPSDIGPRIMGVVEIPDFVHFLTSAKTDFIRRLKHKEFEGLYNPVRQEFKSWLNELGIQSSEVSVSDEALKLERELKKLVDEIPELGEFFGFRGKKTILQSNSGGAVTAESQEGAEITYPLGEGEAGGGEGPLDIGQGPGQALVENQEKGTTPARPISRTSHRGPKIAFNAAPSRPDLAWVDGNNVVINSGHPAYLKVSATSTAKRVHCIFAIANAIQKFMSGSETEEVTFTERMMTAWGKK
jgi:hypothetical protein